MKVRTTLLQSFALIVYVIGQWENVHVIEPELLDDDEEEEVPVTTKKEKGKGRA